MADSREATISTPHSKLNYLCELANARGGNLVNHGAVARKLELQPSRISQLFGYATDLSGTTLPAGMEGRLVNAFNDDQIPLQLGWLALPLPDFKTRFTQPTPKSGEKIGAPWIATESHAEESLVEFRLHDPDPTNRGLKLNATLIFGTIEYDSDGFAISVRDAVATLESAAYRPAEHGGQPEPAAPRHIERIAGGIKITGPRKGEPLHGDPLDGAPLMEVVRRAEGEDDLAVTIHTGTRSFHVTPLDPSAADAVDPATKDALVNLLIERALGSTHTQRPILARATLRRKPDPL